MKFSKSVLVGTAILGMLGLAGCTPANDTAAEEVDPAIVERIDAALAEITGQVLSKGPNGETPEDASTAELTDEQVAEVQDMGLTAAIVMHYGGNDWANAQIAGLNEEFSRLGVEVIATTDANFDPGKQVSDIETVLAQDPDIIVSIPTDPVATASAYRRAAEQGVTLVFMDNVPDGFTAGTDYASMVSADNYGNGVTSAYLLARAMGGRWDRGADLS